MTGFHGCNYKFAEELEKRESVINSQLEENANLLESLAKEQKERLSRPAPTNLNNVPNPSSKELNLGMILINTGLKEEFLIMYVLVCSVILSVHTAWSVILIFSSSWKGNRWADYGGKAGNPRSTGTCAHCTKSHGHHHAPSHFWTQWADWGMITSWVQINVGWEPSVYGEEV